MLRKRRAKKVKHPVVVSRAKASSTSREHDSLEYQVNISFDPRDNIFVARVPELENCQTHGSTPEEALRNAKEAIALWIETAKEKDIPIPEPLSKKSFSGKFVVRTGEKLHASLAKEASMRDQSMNDLILELIDKGLKNLHS